MPPPGSCRGYKENTHVSFPLECKGEGAHRTGPAVLRSLNIRILLQSLTGGFLLLFAQDVLASWYGPQPFRQDRLHGREFDYNAESFLHRFSFEPMPALAQGSREQADGIYGVAGSTRSNEFYLRTEVQATLPLDGPAFAAYRYRRFEDFDGRYDQNLLGVGAQQGGWRAVLWGEPHGDKKETQLQTELRLEDGAGSHLRLILAFPDVIFNQKRQSSDPYYERKPFTYYSEGIWRGAGLSLYGFLNWNAPTRLRDAATGLHLEDEQISGGAGIALALTSRTILGVEVEGLHGSRRRDGIDGPAAGDQRLERRFGLATVELRQELGDHLATWYGVRILYFAEDDQRPQALDQWHRQERREGMVYGGLRLQWRERVALRPGVFINYIDNETRYRHSPTYDKVDRGIYGKLTPAMEFLVNRRTGGHLTVNPSIRLRHLAFGGGNVQLHLPF